MRLNGKVALVTGAASGIGLAITERFLAEGARVIAADIAPDLGKAADDCLPVVLDVGSEADWESVIAIAEQRFGKLDILINNAGLGMPKSLVDLTLEDWRGVMRVNLDGVFLGTKHSIAAMIRAGGGAIVNISSMLGLVATVNASAYCASKGGVTMLTKAAALEMAAAGHAIRVNAVHPGYIETPLLQARFALDPSRRAGLIDSTPVGRLGTIEEVAAAALYLASDEASFVTGTGLVIDGGYTAR